MSQESLPDLPSRKNLLLIALGFFAVTLALYGWGLKNPFVRWDDGLLVYENPAVRAINLQNIAYVFTHYDPELYIPLTFLTYQFDYLIGGGSTVPFHLGNLILHTLNALLCGWIAFLLSRKGWIGLAVGLLFAVHPVHVEAVMWVSARKDVLSGFFFLLSVLLYLYAHDRGRQLLYWGSVAAFALGLLAKVMIIPLPLILILLDLREKRRFDRSMMLDKVPYLLVAFILGIVAILGKTGVLQSSSLTDKVLMSFMSTAFYLKIVFLPLHLSLLHPYAKEITITSPDFYIPIIVLLFITGGAVTLWRRTREPLIWLAWFFLLAAPSFINFAKGEMDTYFASERYMYLSAFGLLFLALLAIDWLKNRFQTRSETVFGILGVILLAAGIKAHAQSRTWKNTETLFQNVIDLYPEGSHVAYNNIGNVRRIQGDLQGALEAYATALTIRPHHMILSNIGATYRKLGNSAEAKKNFDLALQGNPASKEAHFGLGLLLSDQGKYAEAAGEYSRALETDPRFEEAATNMGEAYYKAGRMDDAILAYNRALSINPYFANARYNLAVLYAETGRTTEAINEYIHVTRLAPNFVAGHLNLGLLYYKEGLYDEARNEFETILNINPQNAAARQMLERLPK